MPLDPPMADLEDHRRQVYASLLRLTRNHGEAEDLAQDALLACWRKRDVYEGRGSFVGFVQRTAFRLWLNQRKKQGRRDRLLELDASADSAVAAAAEQLTRTSSVNAFLDHLRQALEDLSAEQRDAFILFRLEGLTCAEIAMRTGDPVKTIETRVRRATLALAERLEPHRHLLTSTP
jgi:RNA polymerase sigma-70 factor, ECF subfamily